MRKRRRIEKCQWQIENNIHLDQDGHISYTFWRALELKVSVVKPEKMHARNKL
jgi:hypothetical protein